MKRILALTISLSFILGAISFSNIAAEEREVIFKMDASDSSTYNVSAVSGSNVTVEDGLIVASGTDTYVSFMLNFITPYGNSIPIDDLEMSIASRLKVECDGELDYVSARVYNSFNTYTSIYLYRSPAVAGVWAESDTPLNTLSIRVGQDALYSGEKITRMRVDLKKKAGNNNKATVYLEHISFLRPPEYDASKIKGKDIIDGVKEQIAAAKPGDTIIIPNGTYENVPFHAFGKGEEGNPITVRAETPGEVIFTGFSKMTIGGEYVTVDGVLFKDGWSSPVIVFASRSQHCRLTNSAIINFNKADKMVSTKWVVMYGKYNRADHNFFRDKKSFGQLFDVMYHTVNDPPEHLIDNNYFGYSELAASNGYEILRFGNTQDWTATMNCTALNNYFDNCDGEGETLCSKSNGNKYINNTLFDDMGAISLRTHKGFWIEGNLFVGNGRNTTRKTGVAVMSSDTIIRNNYFYNLPLSSYAITLENGTDTEGNPAAYIPVTNVLVENNIIVNCGVGISIGTYGNVSQTGVAFPRIHPPTETTISNNLIYSNKRTDRAFVLADPKSEVAYINNHIVGKTGFDEVPDGVISSEIEMEKMENGLYFPKNANVGADYAIVSKAHTSPLQFLPEWIVKKIQSGDPAYKVNDVIPMKLELSAEELAELDRIKVEIDDVRLSSDTDPIMINDRVMVPMRAIFEALGADVTWDDGEASAVGTLDDQEVKIINNSTTAYINGNPAELDAPATIINERFMVPIRFISEGLRARVEWDEITNTVYVSTRPANAGDIDNSILIFAATQSGDDGAGNVIENSFDGELATRWAVSGTEYGSAWGIYDLGTVKTLGDVFIAFSSGNSRVYTFAFEVSTDGQSYTKVDGEQKSSGTTDEFEAFSPLNGIQARYVKFVGLGNNSNAWNNLREIVFTEE